MPIDNLHTRLLENLTTAVVLIDERKRVSYLNPAAEILLETSKQRALNEPLSGLFVEEEDTLNNQPSHDVEDIAYTKRKTKLILTSTGHSVTADYAVTSLPTDEGNFLLLEIQQLDRLLRINREENLLASQDTTRMLVRGLAHEIKNPLGGLRGAAQLLARELPDPNLQDYTRVII